MKNGNGAGFDVFDWTSNKGPTGSARTGPNADHTKGSALGSDITKYSLNTATCARLGHNQLHLLLSSSHYKSAEINPESKVFFDTASQRV